MPLNYLYNDGEIFAVYKPAGIHSVQLAHGGGSSIADELLKSVPALSDSGKNPGDAGLINRLDEGTSGILLGATSRHLWELLFAQAMSGEIRKSYTLLVEGEFLGTHTLTSFLGSPHRGAKKVKVYEKAPSHWARALSGTTTYTSHTYLAHHKVTLVTASASPARRHQVRAHAAHLGYPLIGDTLYGSTRAFTEVSSAPRTFFLHATTVTLIHPLTGAALTVESPFEWEIQLRSL